MGKRQWTRTCVGRREEERMNLRTNIEKATVRAVCVVGRRVTAHSNICMWLTYPSPLPSVLELSLTELYDLDSIFEKNDRG